MNIDLTVIIPVVEAWWPFIAVVAILWYIGQYIKKNAPEATESEFWRFFRRTLPLHPIMAGILLGFIPGFPVPAFANAIGALGPNLYYAFAGFLSIVWHDIYITWRKHKKEE